MNNLPINLSADRAITALDLMLTLCFDHDHPDPDEFLCDYHQLQNLVWIVRDYLCSIRDVA